MGRYIVKRLLLLIPILFVISLISFFIMYLTPGDPAVIMLTKTGEPLDAEVVEALREELSLNDPAGVQYYKWISGIFNGDFGKSLNTERPVLEEIKTYLPNTLKLALFSMALSIIISVPLGILAAVKENKLTDYILRFLTFVSSAVPGFFMAVILILLLAVKLRWLPTISTGAAAGIVIPALTLALGISANYTRQVRAAVIKELGEPYVKMARARGIRERSILFRGVLKSILPSVLTIAGMNFGYLFGGTAIVEVVCTYPGLGNMAISAINNRDYPLIQAYVLLMAVVYVLINLVVDILHVNADMRVRNSLIARGKGKKLTNE